MFHQLHATSDELSHKLIAKLVLLKGNGEGNVTIFSGLYILHDIPLNTAINMAHSNSLFHLHTRSVVQRGFGKTYKEPHVPPHPFPKC